MLVLPKIRGCMYGKCVRSVLNEKNADSKTLLLWEGCLVGYGFWNNDINRWLLGCFEGFE